MVTYQSSLLDKSRKLKFSNLINKVLILMCILVRITITLMKDDVQNQVGEKRVYYLSYVSTSLYVIKGRKDRNFNRAGMWREGASVEDMGRITLYGLLACFLIKHRITSPGMALPAIIWGLTCQIVNKKIIYKIAYSIILWRHLFSWGFLLSDDFSFCQVDIKITTLVLNGRGRDIWYGICSFVD